MGAVTTYLSTISRRTWILGGVALVALAVALAVALSGGHASAAPGQPVPAVTHTPAGCGWNGHVDPRTLMCEGTTSPGVFR